MFRCIFPFHNYEDKTFDNLIKAIEYLKEKNITSVIKSSSDIEVGFLMCGNFYYIN